MIQFDLAYSQYKIGEPQLGEPFKLVKDSCSGILLLQFFWPAQAMAWNTFWPIWAEKQSHNHPKKVA